MGILKQELKARKLQTRGGGIPEQENWNMGVAKFDVHEGDAQQYCNDRRLYAAHARRYQTLISRFPVPRNRLVSHA